MTTNVRKKRTSKKAANVNDSEIRVRINAKTKDKVEKLFKRFGMTTADGVRLLIDSAIREKDLPHIPNPRTAKMIEEGIAEDIEPATIEDLRKIWDDA